jgi:gliding motility-associated-like protein
LDNSSVTYTDPGATGVWTTNSTGTSGQFGLDQFITTGATTTSYFPSASDISRGTVTLTLTSAGAGTCNAISRSVTLNVSNTPIADAGKDLFVCNGANVSLNATPKSNLVSYDWLNITTPGPVINGLEAQAGPISSNVNFELTVTDNRGCTNKDTVAVNAVSDPLITQQDQMCYDFFGYVNVNIGGVTSPLGGFQWFYNGVLMSGENTDSVRVTQPGLYQVSYSLGACTNTSDKATNVLDLPRILTPDYIGCKNSTVTATVTEIANAQLAGLGEQPYNYTWNPGGATTNPAVLATSAVNPNVVDTIMYYVTSSYTTPFITCTYNDSVRVVSIPVPDPALVDSTQVCQGQIVTLDANTPPSNLPQLSQFTQVIEWYAAGSPPPATPALDNDAVFSPTTSNNYVVRVTIGQCTGDDTARVDFRPYPTKILPDEIKQCFEQVGSVILNAGPGSPSDPGFTSVSYQWFVDGALSGKTNKDFVVSYPMIQNEDDEQLIIISKITNHFGALVCPVLDTVDVKDVCVPRIFPPTAFHPGDDNNPDDGFFTIKGKYYTNFKITVYSRWGEVIFYTEDPNKKWDGTYRGELMPVGVYAYVITYEGKDELTKGPFKKEGRIVLVR